jgi:hypothetical protein
MFNAICSRLPGEKPITADEAYRKVWKSEDWGFAQTRDGWRCPECRQPVFLKGPHERTGKTYSFVVHAHFCHHSAAAAANCAMYRASGGRGQSQLERISNDRKQSLYRFFQGVDDIVDYIAALLRAEEDILRSAARDVGAKQPPLIHLASDTQSADEHVGRSAAQIHAHLDRFDGFLAGVTALGGEKNPSIRNGFQAVSGPKNKLRSLFIEFGRNRKCYFDLVAKAGLFEEHDKSVSVLMSQAVTEIEVARQEKSSTYHGMIISVLESILSKLSLSCNHDPLISYLFYLQSFPVLGQRLQDFRLVRTRNEDFLVNHGFRPLNPHVFPVFKDLPAKVAIRQIPSRPLVLPPIRITGARRLLVEARVIERLVAEGSKLDGKSTFIRPGQSNLDNSYFILPGNGCLLLTSSLHSGVSEDRAPRALSIDTLHGDPELPEMIWEGGILLPPDRETSQGVFVNKDELINAYDLIKGLFGGWAGWEKGGLRYRRVRSGLRISMIKHFAS